MKKIIFGKYPVERESDGKRALYPIVWDIVKEYYDSYTLLSDMILDYHSFCYNKKETVHWIDSDIRFFLNTDFYSLCFRWLSQEEEERLMSFSFYNYKGYCKDKVILPSIEDDFLDDECIIEGKLTPLLADKEPLYLTRDTGAGDGFNGPIAIKNGICVTVPADQECGIRPMIKLKKEGI